MSLTELLNIFALAAGLFFAILVFNFLLQRTVKNSARSLFFKLGVFLIFSALVLLTPDILYLLNADAYARLVQSVIYSLWWFSLNFLTNEILTYFIWNRLLPRKGITVSKLLRDLVSFILIIITIAAVFHFVFQQSVVGLFTASGVMAIILGYSAQATLGEAFAGVGLNITKQFDKDDWIGLAGVYGKVVDINWRFVNLITLDGNFLSIPNSQIAKEKITNFSRPSPIHGVTIKISVLNTLSPETVKRFLCSAANQSFKVSSLPPPVATFIEMQPSFHLNLFELNYHTKEHNDKLVTDQIMTMFWYQCERAFATDPANIPFKAEYSTDDIKAFLKTLDLFSPLDDEELAELATQSAFKRYGPLERILTQGQKNEFLFIIYKGFVDVYIKTPDDHDIKVATVPEGKYLGEMSLLTGDPVEATVLIGTESIIIEITAEHMAALFAKRPELVESISAVIVQRKMQNADLRASLKSNAKQEEISLTKQLTARIKNFFKK